MITIAQIKFPSHMRPDDHISPALQKERETGRESGRERGQERKRERGSERGRERRRRRQRRGKDKVRGERDRGWERDPRGVRETKKDRNR